MKALELARGALGTVAVLVPRQLAAVTGADPSDSRVVLGVRVLGVRQVVQAAVTLAHPSRRVIQAGILTDGLHALSMGGLAVVDRNLRRPALTSGAIGATFALAAVRSPLAFPLAAPLATAGSGRAEPPRPAHGPLPLPAGAAHGTRPLAPRAHHETPGGSPSSDEEQHGPSGEIARRRAVAVTERKRALLARTQFGPPPPVRPAAVTGLLVLAAWMLVSLWVLNYPFTVEGQNAVLRAIGFAVLLALPAFWLRQVGRSKVALGLCLLLGALLLAAGLLLPHQVTRVTVNEIGVGVLTLVCALAVAVTGRAGR